MSRSACDPELGKHERISAAHFLYLDLAHGTSRTQFVTILGRKELCLDQDGYRGIFGLSLMTSFQMRPFSSRKADVDAYDEFVRTDFHRS